MLFVDDLLVLCGELNQAPRDAEGHDFGQCFCFGSTSNRKGRRGNLKNDEQGVLCFNEGHLVEGAHSNTVPVAIQNSSAERPTTSWGVQT